MKPVNGHGVISNMWEYFIFITAQLKFIYIYYARQLRGFSGMSDRSAPWQLLLSSTAHKIYHNQLQSQLTRCKKMVESMDDKALFLLEVLQSHNIHNIPIPPYNIETDSMLNLLID